jgi:hypothetical protein
LTKDRSLTILAARFVEANEEHSVMNLRKIKGKDFRRRGTKMVRKANHGTRPCRGKRNSRMGRGNG